MLRFLGPAPQGFEHVPHHTFIGSHEYVGDVADAGRIQSEGHDSEGSGGRAFRMDDFDPYERGEAGCVPLLRGDFYKLINVAVYENAALPKACTPGGFSSSWSGSYEKSWRRLVSKARESYEQDSVVDFHWSVTAFDSYS